MFKNLHLMSFLLSACVSIAAQAGCDNCVATSNLIVFDAANAAPDNDVFLAWNFKGASDVDYNRMLTDGDYSVQAFDQYSNSVTNYFVNKNYELLTEIPNIDSDHYDAVFGAADLSPNHRDSTMNNDKEQGFVFFSIDYKWNTAKILIYKKVMTNGVLSLQLVPGVDINTANSMYKNYLDSEYSDDLTYIRDQASLVYVFAFLESNSANCKESGASYCFDMDANASVPKQPLPDNFSNDVQKHIGIVIDENGQGHAIVINPAN